MDEAGDSAYRVAMKYYSYLWNTFKFVVAPDELRAVLDGYHHVVYTHRVSADYIESDKNRYFDAYQALYEKLVSGYKFVWQQDRKIFDATTGLTDDLQKCTYGASFKDKKDGKFYKTEDFSEPCVGLDLFVLNITEDGRLHTDFSYTQFPEFVAGLEMQYPKNICYYSESTTDKMIPCSEIASFRVYQEIVARVKERTKNLAFIADNKARKTTIKISACAKADFLNFYFARHFHCKYG